MNRRQFLRSAALAGLATAALGVTACVQRTPAGPAPAGTPGGAGTARASKLTVGLTYTPDIQFSPFYVAAEKGYFTDAGLDVTLRHHGASESLFGAIQAGQEHIVYAGGDEMLQARSQGVPLVNFATYYQSYPVVLVVPADSPIQAAADLRGRSVGVPGPYGETWFGLLALLKQAGLAQSDVEIKHIGYTQQAALTTKQVDAVMGYVNNDAVRLQAAGVPVRTIPIAPENPPLVGIGLGTTEPILSSRAEDLAKVHQAVAKAIADIVADPAAAVDLSAKYVPGLNAGPQKESALATLRATIPLFGDAGAFGRQNAEAWTAMATFMQDMGLLANPVTPTDAFTSDVVSAG